jgi:hypothetical protein
MFVSGLSAGSDDRRPGLGRGAGAFAAAVTSWLRVSSGPNTLASTSFSNVKCLMISFRRTDRVCKVCYCWEEAKSAISCRPILENALEWDPVTKGSTIVTEVRSGLVRVWRTGWRRFDDADDPAGATGFDVFMLKRFEAVAAFSKLKAEIMCAGAPPRRESLLGLSPVAPLREQLNGWDRPWENDFETVRVAVGWGGAILLSGLELTDSYALLVRQPIDAP